MKSTDPVSLLKPMLAKAMAAAGIEVDVELVFERPANSEFGDWSCNVALQLAGELKKSPLVIAKQIVAAAKIEKPLEKIEAVAPGFINFSLMPEFLMAEAAQIVKNGGSYGKSQTGRDKTVIVDYSAPNIAKRFSVGHLRSTIIGQALYNLYQFAGWQAIGDNHLGDWGTQFGKMIVAIRHWAKKPVTELTIEELEELYVRFHSEAENQPELEDEGRAAFKALEDGRPAERQLWESLVATSMAEFDAIYDLLGVKIDFALGESFYEDKMAAVIEEGKKAGVFTKSRGALIVDLEDVGLPPALVQKQDGATLYFTRDLATLKYRLGRWQPDKIVYEVGDDQRLHFRQLFATAAKLGWFKPEQLVHVAHGMVRLPEGKMSTRKGRTIKLEAVLQEAISKASQFNPDPKIATAVGVGAVKYNDLKRSPDTNYVFQWDEMLSLKGNSGPYLQYTYARSASVLRKAKHQPDPNLKFEKLQLEKSELDLLRWLNQFSDSLEEALAKHGPHLLCQYLHQLGLKFNLFYTEHSILQADQKQQAQRLLLTAATATVLKTGLTLLGIEALEEM